jgi:hypothetical protein
MGIKGDFTGRLVQAAPRQAIFYDFCSLATFLCRFVPARNYRPITQGIRLLPIPVYSPLQGRESPVPGHKKKPSSPETGWTAYDLKYPSRAKSLDFRRLPPHFSSPPPRPENRDSAKLRKAGLPRKPRLRKASRKKTSANFANAKTTRRQAWGSSLRYEGWRGYRS